MRLRLQPIGPSLRRVATLKPDFMFLLEGPANAGPSPFP